MCKHDAIAAYRSSLNALCSTYVICCAVASCGNARDAAAINTHANVARGCRTLRVFHCLQLNSERAARDAKRGAGKQRRRQQKAREKGCLGWYGRVGLPYLISACMPCVLVPYIPTQNAKRVTWHARCKRPKAIPSAERCLSAMHFTTSKFT